MSKILILGACSAIAQETAKLFAKEDNQLYLADLKIERLEAVKNDLTSRAKCTVYTHEFNALDFEKHQEIFQNAVNTLEGLDIALICYGSLPNQEAAQNNPELLIKEINLNGLSVISLSSIIANYFKEKQQGSLAVITSVAGDRGRQSNFIYGSAKGAVSLYLQGLRNHLSKDNVHVLTIKPGMVDTPMTAHIKKGLLFSSPETIGKGIYDAIQNKKDIAYLPGYWRLIMLIVKLIPESLFKKLSL